MSSGADQTVPPARAWTADDFDPGPGGGDAEAFLAALFALDLDEPLREVEGRETFVWPGRPALVVKRTWGGEARDWWYELLGPEAPRSPGRREAENLAALAADGVPVPRPLAWVEEKGATRHPRFGGRARRSAVVMERIPHTETARDRLVRLAPHERRVLADTVLDVVVQLHGEGWYHRDLYLQHFILPTDREDEVVLLDVGRARQESSPRERWYVKDLAALLHSVPSGIPRAERVRFLRRWFEAFAVEDGAERRRWVEAIEKKAERIASHVPRRVDPKGGVE